MATETADTTPTLLTLAEDAVRLSPLGAVEDAATAARHLVAYLLGLVVPGATQTTGYLGGSGAYSDGKHHGVDLAAPLGSPILAPLPGTIVKGPAGYDGPSTLGNGIYERLADGTVLVFGHTLSGPAVPVGTPVAIGQQIGSVGSSGNSTGPHVHFQVLPPGVTNPLADVDPLAWLRAHLPGVPRPPVLAPVPTRPASPVTPAPPLAGQGQGQGQTDDPGAVLPAGAQLQPEAGDAPLGTATLGQLGPFGPLTVDLGWVLRLFLTMVAIGIIVYGVMKLADVDRAVAQVARAVVTKGMG